jgi:TIR domain
MSDIFVSYTKADREIAKLVVDRLRAEGWTVFWDQDIRAGQKWLEVVGKEVKDAGCMVVLWSENSKSGDWVKEEVIHARDRRVLVQALLDSSELPFGFATLQASNLQSLASDKDSPGIQHLIRGISEIIGNPKPVTVRPLTFAIIVGRPKRWGVQGATVNIDCEFENAMHQPVSIEWLELSATGPNSLNYQMVWNVFYDTHQSGLEHVRRVDENATLGVPVDGLVSGIQFHVPPLGKKVSWPSGEYTFQLRGWADRNRGREPANIRTEFQIDLSDYAASQVKKWLEAHDEMWEYQQASDDAIGIPANPVKVRLGLPAN